jgi:hypothetical protein
MGCGDHTACSEAWNGTVHSVSFSSCSGLSTSSDMAAEAPVAWGAGLCGVHTHALCEQYARKVPGAKYYSMSDAENVAGDCNACHISATCPEIKTTGPATLAGWGGCTS